MQHHPHDDTLATAILETVRLPLLALTADLRVETANDAFLSQFRVTRAETIGRSIYDLGNRQWNIAELRRLLGEILPARSTVSDYRVTHDFERIGRRVMHVSARRIARPGEEDLILLAIVDDTEREALRAELIGRIELADKLIDSVREGLLILDPDLRVRSASGSFYQTFNVEPRETTGQLVYELGNGQWDIPELRQLLKDVLPRQRSFDDYEVRHAFEGIGERTMLLNGRRLDHMDLILLAIRDVTESRASKARLREVATAAHIGVFDADLRAQTLHWSPELREILGYPQDQPPPPAGVVPDFIHPEDRPAVEAMFAAVLDPHGDGIVSHQHRIVRPDGTVRWVQMHGRVEFAHVAGERRPVVIRGVLLDVTERETAEQAVRESEERQAFLLKLSDALRVASDASVVAERALAMLCERLQLDRAFIATYDLTAERVDVAYQRGNERVPPVPERVRSADFLGAVRVTSRSPLVIDDVRKAEGLSDRDRRNLLAFGFGAVLAPAARGGGETPLLGIAAVCASPRRWTAGEVTLVEEVAERTITAMERAMAETALRERERRLRNVLDGMDEGFVLMDHALRIITQNKAALSIDERSTEDIEGRTHGEVYPGSEDSDLGRLYRHALVESVPVALEHHFEFANGTAKWLDMRAYPVPEGLAVFLRDITERKVAEAALRASEARLRRVLDIETVGVMFFDLAGTVLDANEAYLAMIGYERDDLERGDVRCATLTPPEWAWRDEKTITELKAEGRAGPFEKEYFRKDGSRICIFCADKLLDDGTAVEFVVDVTERKQAEAALRESEERYRTLFGRAVDGIWLARPDGTFVDVNPAACSMLGYARDAYLRVSVQDVIRPQDASRLRDLMAALGAGETVTDVWDVRRADGTWMPVEFSHSLTPDGLWQAIGRDVTERRRAEERQNMLMAELDHRVKNILAVVQAIARQTLGPGEAANRDAAEALIGRLAALARSHALLADSRWEGARLGDLMEGALAPHRGQRADRVVVEGPDVKVTPKAAQTLNLALHELVTNAVKYGALSHESGSVSARWHLVGSGDEARLVFNWREHGGPTIERAPSRKGFGSRLIERTLAQELKGKASLEFERGGLDATFVLPLSEIRVEDAGRTSALPREWANLSGDPATLRGKRVLVVEDEELVGQETADVLRRAGCLVTGPIGTLEEALDVAMAGDLDAAVLDINLHGLFVWPAARALRSRGVPLLFATGYSETFQP